MSVHLSHTQLERHQLFPKAGTWRSLWSNSVFHLCLGRRRTTGHGRYQRPFGDPKYGFVLATGFACLLFVGLLLNRIFDPARNRLQNLDRTEYHVPSAETVIGQRNVARRSGNFGSLSLVVLSKLCTNLL